MLILMNAFFTSRFNYFPLIWMRHSRSSNSRMNMLHERCLRIIYNDKQSSFTEFLNKDRSVSIHIRNIQRLAIERFRFYNVLSSPFYEQHIEVKSGKSLQLKTFLRQNHMYFTLKTKNMNILQEKLKNIKNLEHFKKEIET